MQKNFTILVKQVTLVVLLVLVAYLGESGKDGGFIKDLWNAAKTASPFAAMFAVLAWLDERRERREAQQQCYDRTISFVEATNKQSTAMETMVDGIKQVLDEVEKLLTKSSNGQLIIRSKKRK